MKQRVILLFLCCSFNAWAQKADSLTFKQKRNICYATGLGGTAVVHAGLAHLWYSDYPRSSFHFFNDNKEWLQTDKLGHAFSSYYLGVAGIEAARWAGVPENKRWRWAIFGSIFQDPIEIWDGFSAGWGASAGDLAANTFGTVLSAGQEALWHEQKVKMKFSYHFTGYAALRPNVLGSNPAERILKDYNGQTYWLTYSPIKRYAWLGLAVGYSPSGMLGGEYNAWSNDLKQYDYSYIPRYRQYMLSLDIDFTKIPTRSKALKTVFKVINGIKIPAPALELSRGRLTGHGLYF